MTIIKNTSARGQKMIHSANYNCGWELSDVYGRYSTAKKSAWEWCLNKCREEGGYNFHIYSYNTFGFSVAWETAKGIRIETPKNSYYICNT